MVRYTQGSFQFETDIEGGRLRRDVMAMGTLGTTPKTTGLEFIMSGQEELFAFRRAVSITKKLVGSCIETANL
jgi:hypothetical protein